VPGAEIIADEAKSVVHVVSGALKDSIGVEEYNDRVLVAARIDYAATEEFREGGHAYLRPSIDSMSNKADEAIAETVEKKIKEAI
jgi:phage gpG-like protein